MLLLATGLCASESAWGQQAMLVGDAHVSSAQPTVNSGTLSNLDVGGAYTAMMQFDLSMLPAGTTAAQISKATLRVYCNRADVPGAVQAQLVGGAWTELGVTYATLPGVGTVVQTAQVTGAGEFVTFDVTSAVQGWVSAPGTNFGLALAAPAGSGTVVQFDSKENDETSHEPGLEIVLASSGTGTVGPEGPAGPAGATGAIGPQGPVGPAGPQGPQGAQGIPGATGAIGPMGPAGPAGVNGTNGTPGVAGPAGPPGATGATGATGAVGAVGMNFRGVWSAAVEYAVNDAVTFTGSTYLAQAAGSNEEPDLYPSAWAVLAQAGGVGATGATGAAATVAVGSVTTLAAGAQATVTNSGTAQAAVLNFGIPQGAAGISGSGLGSGTGSGAFAAVYHAVSFNTLYYAVNSQNASLTETGGSMLAWVPQGCTATELDVYSQQSAAITVTLRAGPAGALANTALSCSPATNGSCTATGSVVIPAGSFIDLEMSSASGATAGVWTSLQCQ